jgi:hypothetical protein
MAEIKFSGTMKFEGGSMMSATPFTHASTFAPVAEELAGIALNQNGAQTGVIPLEDASPVWQTFRLPADYPRDETIPRISGFQVNLKVNEEMADTMGLDWQIDYFDRGWIPLARGTQIGASEGGSIWFNVAFSPLDLTGIWWRRFRLGLVGRSTPPHPVYKEIVEYDQTKNLITIEDESIRVIPNISPAPLVDGHSYTIEFREQPGVLQVIGGDVYYSTQHGAEGVYYTSPNPYTGSTSVEYVEVNVAANSAALEEFERIQSEIPFSVPVTEGGIEKIARGVGSDIKAYKADGVNPYLVETVETSIRFRILTTAPDVDRDCTGSLYRTVAQISDPTNVRAAVGDLENAYWMSAPNPSRFAVEALYMDCRDEVGSAQVIDHLLVDPITPGIWMNIYYSNDPVPGTTTDEWDGLLWERVPKHFQLNSREAFAMPEPVVAKYLKLEFTQLQARWYSPGTFQLPTQYRKHPSWVLDYYLGLYQTQRANEIESAPIVTVEYDALELAYDYYLDDIKKNVPDAPTTVTSSEGVSLITGALSAGRAEEENKVDAVTLQKINTSMQPFLSQPAQQGGAFDSVLQKIASATASVGNYPVERVAKVGSNTTEVSSLERDSLIVEKQFPVTSFYLTCRHYYQVSEATFEEDRAYFAAIKEVTATREHYASRIDAMQYTETAGDENNIEMNDLPTEDHTWVTFVTSEEDTEFNQ